MGFKCFRCRKRIKKLEDNASKIKTETIHTMNKLKDEKNLLIYRYIDWLSWAEFEEAMFAFKSTLIRIHKRALDNLQI